MIKNGKIRMIDLAVEFQMNVFRNDGLIGYKALNITLFKRNAFAMQLSRGHV